MFRVCLAIVALCLSSSVSAKADKKAAGFARMLPAEANTVSVVHLQKILDSSRGKREGWSESQEQRFLDGHVGLPPWVDTFVMGSLTRPGVPEEVWAAAVIDVPSGKSLQSIADESNLSVTKLADWPAVQTSSGAFLVELADKHLAGYRPSHRQEAVAWLRTLNGDHPTISPYLLSAAGANDDIVMSIDLKDMFDVQFVESYLKQDKRFASQHGLIPRLTPLLSTLRGVTMKIDIGETSQCEVMIDFGDDVGPLSAIAKTLFLTAVEDAGAHIEEFRHAKISTHGQSVALNCELTDESVMRILSVIVPPRVPQEQYAAAPQEPTEEPAEETVSDEARAARRYVRAVNDMIGDLRRASERIDSYQKTIAWHQAYARKIDQLSTRNVPQELVDIGGKVANEFRALARSLTGQAVEVDARNKSVVYNYNVDPGWWSANIWGGAGYSPTVVKVDSNLEQVRAKQADAVIKGAKDRDQIWQMIEEQSQEMDQILGGIK
ncbi:hypothetical protein [Rubinisphaera margarita]|uniref:hypothetical protein n=1 Tax=Rubinisphaera margarita TaxID=2909586 RepID=UPI001EE941CE|nr:hypothetical protein [Rubinisphaera margarita]MCG6155719.1 hypothetical protein [Rubinisphaera margarita]